MSWLKQSPSSNSLKDSMSSSRSKPAASLSPNSSAASKSSNSRITRFLACGTVYITHTLSVPPSIIQPFQGTPIDTQAPGATTSVRAKQVTTQRGGSAVNILSILAQFNALSRSSSPSPSRRTTLECALVSPLGSDAAGRALMHELELEGIRTRFCKVHQAGVPLAFVLRSDENPSRTIINHNPLPELSHEDFISILGPILVPEHYHGILTHQWHPHPSLPQPPPVHHVYGPGPGLPPITTLPPNAQATGYFATPGPNTQQPLPPTTPGLPTIAPFTVFHLTGRSVSADGITLLNLTGVDGLARDRFWRDKTTFSLDCTAPIGNGEGRDAREKLFPHVDVIFYSKAYALSVNPSTPAQKMTPRSFLLSQVPLVAKHALLLIHWEHDGAALLSIPTREYLQCSVWADSTSAAVNPPNLIEEVPKALNPVTDIRPDTQLSLGSDDPRYKEFDTVSSHPGRNAAYDQGNTNRALPDWSNEYGIPAANQRGQDHAADPAQKGLIPSGPPSGNVMNHVDASPHADAPGFATFDYGFADAFANVTPDSSWDYRANRTAVIYDSGDDSDTGFVEANTAARGTRGLELQTDIVRIGQDPSGVMISEGVALSPSDVDSDMDGNAAAMASRFVMEERMRRVYGPLDGDVAESDELDLSSIDQQLDTGNDSDATEDGQLAGGPTRIGKLKREKLRQKAEMELERARMEEQELAFGEMNDLGTEKDESFSVRSHTPPPKVLPPMPPGAVEAWQAGLLYALTRHVLPGQPYCPTVSPAQGSGSKADTAGKPIKKPDSQEVSDWGWKWRLDEFAAELSGRRAQKGTMEGLAREMQDSGWL